MKVICISAKARGGKDTVAEMLSDEFKMSGNSVLIIHYADYLKFICEKYFGWNGKKDVEGRTLLQFIGTDVVRNQFDQNFWVKSVVGILKMFESEWEYVLIPDTRFPNEIEEISKTFETLSVRINRDNNELTEAQRSHVSETALDDYKFDFVIENDGTLDELKEKVKKLKDDIER